MYLTGNYSVPQVLRTLNEDWGYLTVKRQHVGGKSLSRTGLYCIFNNPRYAGCVPNPYEDGKYYPVSFKSMITEEEYDQVQKLLGDKSKPRLCASKQFALKGFIKCGECGCMITAEMHKKKLADGGINEHTYYHCTRKRPCSQRGSIREQDLFDKITALLDQYELTPEFYEWGMAALKEMADGEVAERNGIQVMQYSSIDEIQNKLDNLLQQLTDRFIDGGEYKKMSEPLKVELKRLQNEQKATANRTKNWYEFVGKQLETLTLANSKFVKGDLSDKKEILLSVGQNPLILDGELLITPNPWMIPIRDNISSMRKELDNVRTMPDKIQMTSVEAIKEAWCRV
jgi:site-specific DNA recombinase